MLNLQKKEGTNIDQNKPSADILNSSGIESTKVNSLIISNSDNDLYSNKIGIDNCIVSEYNLTDLTKMYYNNPGTLIPVLLNIYHSPNVNKANKKIINKFKQIIEYNKNNTTNKKSLNISKANFYL